MKVVQKNYWKLKIQFEIGNKNKDDESPEIHWILNNSFQNLLPNQWHISLQ